MQTFERIKVEFPTLHMFNMVRKARLHRPGPFVAVQSSVMQRTGRRAGLARSALETVRKLLYSNAQIKSHILEKSIALLFCCQLRKLVTESYMNRAVCQNTSESQ